MKKRIIAPICVALVLGATACGSSSNESTTTTTAVAETTVEETAETTEAETTEEVTTQVEPEETNLTLGEMTTLGDWEITANSYEVTKSISSSAYTSFKADEGSSYVVVNVTVKNTGTSAASFLPSFTMGDDVMAKIIYQDKYEYSSSQLLAYSDDLHSAHLNPLESKTGIIAFSVVDEAANSDELLFKLYTNSKTLIYNLK